MWRQAESTAVTAAGTREEEEMPILSLPSPPWGQACLGGPSCPGHPVMETAIQRGHSCRVVLWGADAEGLPEAKEGQGLVQGLQPHPPGW